MVWKKQKKAKGTPPVIPGANKPVTKPAPKNKQKKVAAGVGAVGGEGQGWFDDDATSSTPPPLVPPMPGVPPVSTPATEQLVFEGVNPSDLAPSDNDDNKDLARRAAAIGPAFGALSDDAGTLAQDTMIVADMGPPSKKDERDKSGYSIEENTAWRTTLDNIYKNAVLGPDFSIRRVTDENKEQILEVRHKDATQPCISVTRGRDPKTKQQFIKFEPKAGTPMNALVAVLAASQCKNITLGPSVQSTQFVLDFYKATQEHNPRIPLTLHTEVLEKLKTDKNPACQALWYEAQGMKQPSKKPTAPKTKAPAKQAASTPTTHNPTLPAVPTPVPNASTSNTAPTAGSTQQATPASSTAGQQPPQPVSPDDSNPKAANNTDSDTPPAPRSPRP